MALGMLGVFLKPTWLMVLLMADILRSPVEGQVVEIPLLTTGFSTIPGGLVSRISEPSTVGKRVRKLGHFTLFRGF